MEKNIYIYIQQNFIWLCQTIVKKTMELRKCIFYYISTDIAFLYSFPSLRKCNSLILVCSLRISIESLVASINILMRKRKAFSNKAFLWKPSLIGIVQIKSFINRPVINSFQFAAVKIFAYFSADMWNTLAWYLVCMLSDKSQLLFSQKIYTIYIFL